MDADIWPDDVTAWACTVPPGSAVLIALAAVDPRRLSHDGLLNYLDAWEKHSCWLQARQYRGLAELTDDPAVPGLAGEVGKDWVREQVACALRLSFSTAAHRLALARELVGRLPGTLDLQEHGQLSTHHSRSLAEATMALDSATATQVEELVLATAPEQTLASFRRSLRRAVLTAAPQTAEERHTTGLAERRVVRMPGDEAGMAGIWMLLPDAGASVLMSAIDALARRVTSDDPRTADQRPG